MKNYTTTRDTTFIRGFGKISPRTQSGLALRGERAFADCDQAVRFVERIALRQDNLKKPLFFSPWFRRLYYDGEISGRFEFGFLAADQTEEAIFRMSNEAGINPPTLGQAILTANVQINSVDGRRVDTRFVDCAEPLGLAYLSATTDNVKIASHTPKEIYGHAVKIGSPILHARISSNRYIESGRDRRLVSAKGQPDFFLTSSHNAGPRNGIIVQASRSKTLDETTEERITRVLFAHVNSIIFAHSHFSSHYQRLGLGKKELRAIVKSMLERISRFSPAHIDSSSDNNLHNALELFSRTHEGRVDELTGKLEHLSKKLDDPSLGESIIKYLSGLHELIVKTTVETVVKTAVKN